jgi:purine-binding chemotaxis protein CheW
MERQRRKDPFKNLVECIIGDVRYGVAIGAVREIVNPLPTVPLPSAPAWIVGVADYRDEVVPVVDLRTRFGIRGGEATRRTKWIVAHKDDLSFALVVDAVTEVFRSGEVRPAPPLAAGAEVRSIEGVTSHDGEMVFVLDVARLAELVQPTSPVRPLEGGRQTVPPPRRDA